MGQARAKRLAGVPRPTVRTPLPPKYRRRGRAGEDIRFDGRDFLLHADGTVYEGRAASWWRVKDTLTVEGVRLSSRRLRRAA